MTSLLALPGPAGRMTGQDVWKRTKSPTPEEIKKIHEKAHHACFIADSVLTEVSIES